MIRPAMGALLAAAAILALASGASPPPARAGAPEAAAPDTVLPGREELLLGLGFENVSVWPGGAAFEDRRRRHVADALGALAAREPGPAHWVVRRLGLPAAEIDPAGGEWPPRLRFPSDGPLSERPVGPVRAPTTRRLDLVLRPTFSYELGRIYDPVLARTALQPELVINPWPGGRARIARIIPLRNNFGTTDLHPDVNRPRLGPATLEQYFWLGRAGLASATGGLLGDNRFGFSLGLAKPLWGGALLLDSQLDETGFWASSDSGFTYSALQRTSGYLGVTLRPRRGDLALRLRAARFLYGDQGIEAQVERSLGDLDVAFFVQRTQGFRVTGVRLGIPFPPLERPTGPTVWVLPPERVALDYRDTAEPLGAEVPDVASRAEFLRHLSVPALASNLRRYQRARDGVRDPGSREDLRPVSWVGMTGFVTTPWCGVQADRRVEVGYSKVPKPASWDHRGEHSNEVYYASLGYLPRLELGLRWTVIPGLKTFQSEVPDTRLTDSDRMASARLALLDPRGLRPGVAIGIEDAVGTRRFHSTYVVAGVRPGVRSLQGRLALGYAPRVLEATHHVLAGAFGAAEIGVREVATVAVEHDQERWNAGIGVHPGFGVHLRAAWFDLRHPGFGVGWSTAL